MRQQVSPVLASLANVFRIPTRQIPPVQLSSILNRACSGSVSAIMSRVNVSAALPGNTRAFSTTQALAAKKKRPQIDRRITLIRYFLYHPLTPRPLRFSRNRYLRHWTIHRAWQLYQHKQRAARELELEKQWNCMRDACEELRTGAGDGGKLFRVSMNKKGVFSTPVPIEYGRMQMDTPSKEGWNYEWTP